MDKISKNFEYKGFDFKTIDEIKTKEISFLLEDFLPLPVGTVTMLSAKNDSGKSALALQLGLRASAQKIPTLAWLSEDPKYIIVDRAKKIAKDNNLSINNYLHFLYTMPFQVLTEDGVNPLFYEFKAICKDFKIIILDPLISFYGADENSNSDARRFMDLFTEWAGNEDKVIIFTHHQAKFAKEVNIARGAGAFTDAVRAIYTIKKDDADDRFVIAELLKDNWGIKTFFNNQKKIKIWGNHINIQKNQKQNPKNKNNKEKVISSVFLDPDNWI